MKKTNFVLGKDKLQDNLISSKQLDYSSKDMPNATSKDFIDKIKNTNIQFDAYKNDFLTTNQIAYQEKESQKVDVINPNRGKL